MVIYIESDYIIVNAYLPPDATCVGHPKAATANNGGCGAPLRVQLRVPLRRIVTAEDTARVKKRITEMEKFAQ